MNLIVFASPLHDSGSVMSCRKGLFADLEKDDFRRRYGLPGGPLNVVDCSAEELPQEELVCFIATGGTEELFRGCIDRLPSSGEIVLLSDGYHNSFAASFEIASWLDAIGRASRMVNVPLAEESAAAYVPPVKDAGVGVDHDVYTARVREYLAGSVVGLIGAASSWLIASDVDKEAVAEKFGVRFVEIPIGELVDRYEAAELGDHRGKGLCGAIEEQRLRSAEAMQAALEEVVEKYGLTALTLKCFDLLTPCRTTACLALARLNDKGIVSGCEGDLPALWTMMTVYAETGRAPFMANPSSSDRSHLTVDFAHCTIPLGMTTGYTLPTHFESGIGVGIAGTLPLGRYKLTKIGGPLLDKVYAAEGTVVANTHIAARCRTQISFSFDSVADYDAFMAKRLGNHVVLSPV